MQALKTTPLTSSFQVRDLHVFLHIAPCNKDSKKDNAAVGKAPIISKLLLVF